MDIQLYYEEKGAGEPLILLHGNGESGDYFSRQIDAFAARFRVIALDTRGHGRSPRGTAPFTISQFAEDLLDFMDEQGIDRAHLLGFSDGGNIAMLFALRHPERVDRLILDGANLKPSGVVLPVQVLIELGYRFEKLRSRWSAKARAKAELLGLMVHEPHIEPDALAALHMPTLVLAGTHDLIKASETRLIAASIPDSRLQFLKGGHAVAAENPADFNRAVLDFLCEAQK